MQKSNILILRNKNLTIQEINKRVGFRKSSIGEFLKNFDRTRSLKKKTGSGAKNKKSSREDRMEQLEGSLQNC